MQQEFFKDEPIAALRQFEVNLTDGDGVPVTSPTGVVISISKNNAAFVTPANGLTSVGKGVFYVQLEVDEVDTISALILVVESNEAVQFVGIVQIFINVPTAPTLSIPALTVGETVLATVTGFDSGTTNNIYVKGMLGGWPSTPEEVADAGGLATLTLSPGMYWAKVESVARRSISLGFTDPIKFVMRSTIMDELSHSPAFVVAQYLIDLGVLSDPVASDSEWPVYVASLPDDKNIAHKIVGSIDTTPVKDGRPMMGDPLFHFGVQLLIRSDDYIAGYAKASDLAGYLADVDNVEVIVDSITYLINCVNQTSGVIALGQEEGTKRRELFSINFLITMKEA